MRYNWVLFDADETLFSFNSYLGLTAMLKRYGIDFTREDYDAFQAVNKLLWVAYQNNEITAEDIQMRRFAKLAEQTSVHQIQLNQELMAEMAKVSKPLDGVILKLKWALLLMVLPSYNSNVCKTPKPKNSSKLS